MDTNRVDFPGAAFQRRPGGRRGCGCCGFWFTGLMAIPGLLIAAAVALI